MNIVNGLDLLAKYEERQGIYYNQGPFVAFAYERDNLALNRKPFLANINLTYHNELNPHNLGLCNEIYETLRRFKGKFKIDEEDYRFNLSLLIAQEDDSFQVLKEVVYLSVGVTKEYFSGKTNNDFVDAMYLADSFGNSILQKRFSKENNLFWGYSNYNFNELNFKGRMPISEIVDKMNSSIVDSK